MPDTRISDLTVLTAPAAGDLIPIVDISDTTMAASGTTKRVTQSVLLASVQPLDANLTALAGVTLAPNTFPARSSSGILAAKPITDFGLSLIDDAAASNARTTLGLAIGTDVLAYQPTQIQFGGATSLFPMLLRSGAILKARLANNSDYAQVQAQTFGNKDASATSYVLDFSSTTSMFPQFLVDSTNSNALTQIRLFKKESGSNTLTIGGEVGLITWNGMSFLKGIATANVTGGYSTIDLVWRTFNAAGASADRVRFTAEGQVGIGTSSPSYLLHVNTDSAGKPGVGGLWTVVSDERIKTDIVPADLDRCYDIVKQVGLKHFGFKPGVYSDEQINDKHSLGWIAQDVQKVFGKAVSIKPFTLQTDIPDGTEEYEEQEFTVETVNKVETSIQVINGKPVQASKTTQVEEKTLLFDEVVVVDVAGDIVMVDGAPLTHKVPRMVTKTRPKVRREVIEDCLDLNGGQMNAALYGAVQCLMAKVEAQAVIIASLQASVAEQAHS